MDLFDHALREDIERNQPLAARMRPRVLDEFIGQEHIVGPGRLLRRMIQADQLSSVIFYGPPGTGKTTLARVIANTTRAHFIAINAVLAGVQDIRNAVSEAQERRRLYRESTVPAGSDKHLEGRGQRTVLFVDEVHRFNKAQQDALLPWVENGTIILIGATTENPYFSVNKPLVSRSHIFQLRSLSEDDLRKIVAQALADSERGYGRLRVELHPEALNHLVNIANGDARKVLNALELAVETSPPGPDGIILVDRAVAEESIQRRAVLYDKEGDVHFDTISAFIKSLRGSDPDAALYWMARMIYAGEDPRFIFRRMLILAAEDVGLADPNALRVVTAAADAFDYVGLPEGRFHLAEACLYLATAPKSNSAMAFFDALATVEHESREEVPNALKDASRDTEGFGHGQGYLYPHAYRDHWVAQQYLPDSLQGKVFYQPSDQGYEAAIRAEVARRREAQLAAMLAGESEAPVEHLTAGPRDPIRERWLARTLSSAGERLGSIRDRVLHAAHLSRHAIILDLAAGTGLLTWDALRRAPEGRVIALTGDRLAAHALQQQADQLPELARPTVILAMPGTVPVAPAAVDAIVGRNALTPLPDWLMTAQTLAHTLRPGGWLSLAEIWPRQAQRLYALLDLSPLERDLAARLVAAEEAIYLEPDDPTLRWDTDDVRRILETAGFHSVTVSAERQETEQQITGAILGRWFSPAAPGSRHSYADHLLNRMTTAELGLVRSLFERQMLNQVVPWTSTIVYMAAEK